MEEPHPPDCPCCRVVVNRRGAKRTRADADLSAFLPEAVARAAGEEGEEEEGEEEEGEGQPEWQEPEGGEGEEGEEVEEEVEEEGEEDQLIHDALFRSFETHVERLDAARLRRIETLSFKSALEDDGKKEINEDATQDEIDGLGVWLPGDEFQGDVNMRTLQKLLTRVDQRGFERSAQQLEARPSPFPVLLRVAHVRALSAQFHVAFMKAAARVIYRGSWETERPAIMKRYGWETSNSEVLISTPRRFGKTFSIAIFCACLSLAFGLEVVVFSPARRASRKLLERIVEFIRLAGGEKRICEYNQEACRLNAFDGRKSLIRSFPSKVGVRAVATLEPVARLAGA